MKKERLVVVHAQLAFAVPAEATDDEVFDMANCMLIPDQRREDPGSDFIDYTLGDIYVSATPVDKVTHEDGFVQATRAEVLRDAIKQRGVDDLRSMSDDDLNGELATIVDDCFDHDDDPAGELGELIDLAHDVYEGLL